MKRFAFLALTIGILFLPSCGGPSAPNPVVLIETSKGNIKAELFQDKAPITVANFLKYVDEKHYDGTVFHRVIPDFMIQGGGFNEDLEEKPTGKPITNESYNGLQNQKYTLAMARTSVPNSATSQFFINVKDNPFLDKANAQDKVGYAVFGKVIEGKDVVEAIRTVKTSKQKMIMGGITDKADDVPVDPVIIKSIRRVEAK